MRLESDHPARLQVLRREDHAQGPARDHGNRRAERLRQEQHLGGRALGARRAEREVASRPAHGGPHLPRLGLAQGRSALPRSSSSFSNDGAALRAVDARSRSAGASTARARASTSSTRSASRLRDILDLFAGTGANPRAYSVMDQDKLNHVLTAKPHERRVFIEEAAGIARYKQQRNETQGKLDGDPPEPGARARRHGRGQAPARLARAPGQEGASSTRRCRASGASWRWRSLAADYAALTTEAERLAEPRRPRVTASKRVRARIAAVAGAAGSGSARRSRRASIASPTCARPSRRSRASSSGSSSGASRWGPDPRAGDEEPCGSPRISVPTAERPASASCGERADCERGAAPRREPLDGRARARARGAGGGPRAPPRPPSPRSATASRRCAWSRCALAAERMDLMREAGELRERQAQLSAARRAAGAPSWRRRGRGRAAGRAPRGRWKRRAIARWPSWRPWKSERERLAAAVAEGERSSTAAESRLAEHARGAGRRADRASEALRELERAREGYGAGVRAVFADGRPTPSSPGVVGTVADLLEVPAGLERAVEAVLGERLQWVVVERFEHARAAVHTCRRPGRGSGHVPAARAPAARRPTRSPTDNGVRWVARDVSAPTSAASFTTSSARWASSNTSTMPRPSGGATASWPRTSRPRARCSGPPDVSAAGRREAPRGRALAPGAQAPASRTGARGHPAHRAPSTSAQTEAASARRRGRDAPRERLAGLDAVRAGPAGGARRQRQGPRAGRAGTRTCAAPRGRPSGGVAASGRASSTETRATLARLERRVATARDAESRHEQAMAARPGGSRDRAVDGTPRSAPS